VAHPDLPRPKSRPDDRRDPSVRAVLLSTTPPGATWRLRSGQAADVVLKPKPALRLSSLLMVVMPCSLAPGPRCSPSCSSPMMSRWVGSLFGASRPALQLSSGRCKAPDGSSGRRSALSWTWSRKPFPKGPSCHRFEMAARMTAFGNRDVYGLRPRWALSGPRAEYPRCARARAEDEQRGPRVAVGRTRTVISKKEAALRRP
jgi:hypothetical protein